jgi:hypothetical protein
MYIRKTKRVYKGKTYINHLLVESVLTPKGPRQRTICSLGSLEPAPSEQWLMLAHKMESALQGQLSVEGAQGKIEPLLDKVRRGRRADREIGKGCGKGRSLVVVDVDRVETEEHREAGPVHVGHQIWGQLGLDKILLEAGLSERACTLSEAMTLNRLVFSLSELAMPDWIRRTALGDILGEDFSKLNEDSLYRNLDRLHPNREPIERELAERERTLFNLDETLYLYDLTSTYFEGQAEANPQAKRGYSRDKRPDCKQVLVGLVLDRDGFPKAHEIFEGNRQDRSTVKEMIEILRNERGGNRDRRWWLIEGWPMRRICVRSVRTVCTISWQGDSRNAMSGWMILKKRGTGKKSYVSHRLAMRFRTNRGYRSSAVRKETRSTFCA